MPNFRATFTLCDGPHSVECASLCIWINPLLTYHFVSHWILSVIRHQEPELHQVLKPGTVDFGWVRVPAMWVLVPSRVLAGFESQSKVNHFKITETGRHSLLQGIFPTQGSKSVLPHCRWILYCLNHQGSLSTDRDLLKFSACFHSARTSCL